MLGQPGLRLADPLIAELAEQSAEGTNPEKIAALARKVLALASFQPGFDVEPALPAGLEAALEAVKEDMRATSLAGPVRLIITDWNCVELRVRPHARSTEGRTLNSHAIPEMS